MPKVRPNHIKVKAATAMLALWGTAPALADDGPEATHGEMVVTANRVATESEKIGSAVTVITGEEMERKQIRTVADALREVPGVAVSQTGAVGNATAVRIRGAEAYHTKLIIDGIDMSDPSNSQPQYDFGHLTAADIERIEVVRGPQSLLYGGEAIGGVINIVTRQGQGKPRVSAMAEGGSLHTGTVGANISGSEDKVSYAFGVSRFHTDGISSADKNRGFGNENDPYDATTLNVKLGFQLTDIWRVDASGRYLKDTVHYDTWSGGMAKDDTNFMNKEERSGRIGTTLDLFDKRWSNTIAYSTAQSDRDIWAGQTYDYYKGAYSRYSGQTEKFEYQGTAKLAQDHTLVYGAEHKSDSMQSSALSSASNRADFSKRVDDNGTFADYQFSPLDSLYLTVGGRLDDHQTFGTHTTYRGTAAYLVDATATRLHASYGTGFRAPSLYELYHPIYGNSTLQPEESRGWDAGIEQSLLNNKLNVDVTWFMSRIENLIQWSTTYKNVASTVAKGVEMAAHLTVTDQLRLNGTYTFTDSRDDKGQILARRPKNQGTFGATWAPLDGLSLDGSVRAVGFQYDSATGRYMGDYATVNLAAGYDLTETVRLTGRVENLFDKKYEEVDTYGTLGRMAYLGISTHF